MMPLPNRTDGPSTISLIWIPVDDDVVVDDDETSDSDVDDSVSLSEVSGTPSPSLSRRTSLSSNTSFPHPNQYHCQQIDNQQTACRRLCRHCSDYSFVHSSKETVQ